MGYRGNSVSTRYDPSVSSKTLTQTAIALIGAMKPDWESIWKSHYYWEFGQPAWWLPAVPTYLGLGSGTQADIHKYLIRMLRDVARGLADTDLPRAIIVHTDSTRTDFERQLDLLVAYRLVMSTWKDGILHLMHEIDYFWEQAIDGPHVEDFTRLKASKQYAVTMYQDLGAWMVNMEELLSPQNDRSGERAMNELKDLLGQISTLKQEISDTFQLLIGAIAIKDSEIQKKLARESKLQARRSTALTALAAVYLPLSLTTGVFGMNISEIESGQPKYWAVLALGIGLLVATLPFLLWVFFDKDDEDEKRERGKTSRRLTAGSETTGRDRVYSTVDGRDVGDINAKPPDSIRRRTTRFSQMSRVVSGRSRPASPHQRAQLAHMV